MEFTLTFSYGGERHKLRYVICEYHVYGLFEGGVYFYGSLCKMRRLVDGGI